MNFETLIGASGLYPGAQILETNPSTGVALIQTASGQRVSVMYNPSTGTWTGGGAAAPASGGGSSAPAPSSSGGTGLTSAQAASLNEGARVDDNSLAAANWRAASSLAEGARVDDNSLASGDWRFASGLGEDARVADNSLASRDWQFAAGLGEDARQFDVGEGNENWRFSAGLGEDARVADNSLASRDWQFGAGLGEDARQADNALAGTNWRFGAGLAEDARATDNALNSTNWRFGEGLAEDARQFNVGEMGTNDRARLAAALGGFESVNNLAPKLGELALANAQFTADMTRNPADYVARAFFQRGGESPLPVVSQADLINQLSTNIAGFNTALGGFQTGALNNPQFLSPSAYGGYTNPVSLQSAPYGSYAIPQAPAGAAYAGTGAPPTYAAYAGAGAPPAGAAYGGAGSPPSYAAYGGAGSPPAYNSYGSYAVGSQPGTPGFQSYTPQAGTYNPPAAAGAGAAAAAKPPAVAAPKLPVVPKPPTTSGGGGYPTLNPDYSYLGSAQDFQNLVAGQIAASGEDYNAPQVAAALFYANDYNLPYSAKHDWAGGIDMINEAMGVPSYDELYGRMAFGGQTTAPMFMTGDSPSGAPTGNEEMIMNPTNAPLSVVPNPGNQMGIPTSPPSRFGSATSGAGWIRPMGFTLPPRANKEAGIPRYAGGTYDWPSEEEAMGASRGPTEETARHEVLRRIAERYGQDAPGMAEYLVPELMALGVIPSFKDDGRPLDFNGVEVWGPRGNEPAWASPDEAMGAGRESLPIFEDDSRWVPSQMGNRMGYQSAQYEPEREQAAAPRGFWGWGSEGQELDVTPRARRGVPEEGGGQAPSAYMEDIVPVRRPLPSPADLVPDPRQLERGPSVPGTDLYYAQQPAWQQFADRRGRPVPRYANGTDDWYNTPEMRALTGFADPSMPENNGTVAGTTSNAIGGGSSPQSFYQTPPVQQAGVQSFGAQASGSQTYNPSIGMNFTAPQLPTSQTANQAELIDYAQRFGGPAVNSIFSDRLAPSLRFGFPLPNPQQLSMLTPAEYQALNTRLATEFNTSTEDLEHAVRQRFTNARTRPRGRYAVGR